MKSIPFLVGLALLALTAHSGTVAAQEPPRPVAKFTSVFRTSGPPRQVELVQQILDFAPGAATREHSHGGPAFVTVLEGQSTIREGATEKVYGPGETYMEAEGVVHTAFNRTSGRTRVLSSFLLSPGAQQTLNRPDSPVPAAPAVATYLSRTMLGTQPAEFAVIQAVNEFAPGALLPLHTHGGPALAMVIEGEITFEVGDARLRRTPGEFFEENDVTLVHQARNTGAGPATVVVTFLIPTGAQTTTFVMPSSPPAQAAAVVPANPSDAAPKAQPPSAGDGGLVTQTSSRRDTWLAISLVLVISGVFAFAIFRRVTSRRRTV